MLCDPRLCKIPLKIFMNEILLLWKAEKKVTAGMFGGNLLRSNLNKKWGVVKIQMI